MRTFQTFALVASTAPTGPDRPLAFTSFCCAAARQSRLSLRSRNLAVGEPEVYGRSDPLKVVCIAARMCNSNNCPVGIATQKPKLCRRLDIQQGAERLARFFGASVERMQVMARAWGHD